MSAVETEGLRLAVVGLIETAWSKVDASYAWRIALVSGFHHNLLMALTFVAHQEDVMGKHGCA